MEVVIDSTRQVFQSRKQANSTRAPFPRRVLGVAYMIGGPAAASVPRALTPRNRSFTLTRCFAVAPPTCCFYLELTRIPEYIDQKIGFLIFEFIDRGNGDDAKPADVSDN